MFIRVKKIVLPTGAIRPLTASPRTIIRTRVRVPPTMADPIFTGVVQHHLHAWEKRLALAPAPRAGDLAPAGNRRRAGADDVRALAGLLRDAVENGASVGYVMPIDEEDPGRLCTSDGKAT